MSQRTLFCMITHITLAALAFAQNTAFSVVSRSRNRNNITYHVIASVFSNGIWFLTFRQLVASDMTLTLFPAYCLGTVLGSVFGVKVSMRIERLLRAESDSHLT